MSLLTKYQGCFVIASMVLATGCTATSVSLFQGTWKLNVERTIAIDSALNQKAKADPKVRSQLHQISRRGAFRVFNSAGVDYLETNDGTGTIKRWMYKVLQHSPGRLIVDAQNISSQEVRRMEVSFFGEDAIEIFAPQKSTRIAFRRSR